ncbi:hypothetical protein LH51_13300 [Nitrincola sp. A-D6]|nr:hypothetical protein LH51_13300 [Nitrincola sp. A-D6]
MLALPTGIFIATEVGLYQLQGALLSEVSTWHNQPVKGIAASPQGYLLLLESDNGQTLYLCDEQWQVRHELPCPPGETIKCLHSQDTFILAGTKHGVFRLPLDTENAPEASSWQCLFKDFGGWGEVLWIHSENSQHIRASIKKLAPDAKPALIETRDGGISWQVEAAADYQDLMLAANDQHWISRWKGIRQRHATSGYKKHPLTAAWLSTEDWALLDGNKLEYQQAGQAILSFTHPLLAEAKWLYPLHQQNAFLIAGVQGAYLVEPGKGSVSDLFTGITLPGGLGKLKQVFELDDGVRLATATYGTFRSEDGGNTWKPADAEWSVLNAKHLIRSDDGRWWLGCQRALFVSDNNGQRWRYIKLKLEQMPHYAELSGGLAIIGDQLFIGSKTGLLVTQLNDPERVSRVAAFGTQAIKSLFTDQDHKHLLVNNELKMEVAS